MRGVDGGNTKSPTKSNYKGSLCVRQNEDRKRDKKGAIYMLKRALVNSGRMMPQTAATKKHQIN